MADTGVQQAEIVVNFRDRPNGRAGIVAGAFLFDGNSGRQPLDGIHIGLAHLFEELPGISRERLHVPPLAFGIDGIKRQGGLPRPAQPSDDDEFVSWNLDIEILQIVLTRTFHDNGIAHKGGIITRRSHTLVRLIIIVSTPGRVIPASIGPRPCRKTGSLVFPPTCR